MKGVIIYTGKYGATRQYAEWIGEELKFPVLTSDEVNLEKLKKNDFVVIGSSVYMGKLLIRDWLKRNINFLQNKMLFLFVVCATPDSEKQKQGKIIEDNVPALLMLGCHVVFLPGRLIRKELSWKDRLIVNLGSRLEKDPVKKRVMLQDIDGVKKENLSEIIKAIRAFISGKDVFLKAISYIF